MTPDTWRAVLLAAVMAAASALAVALTPRQFLAELHPRERLADLVPETFGRWELDRGIVPVPPSPDVQQVLDATYDETLARTYRGPGGQRVMLSVAYGRNQHKGMNTHRPEVCYPAQGFRIVQGPARASLQAADRRIDATRVVTALGGRTEPVTYWLLVGDRITYFGYAQRAAAIAYGLRGIVPDGVLVRVSTIDDDPGAAFAVHERFIADMLAALPPARRPRLLGGATD